MGSVELEEIVKRVHELSDSIPRRSSSQGFHPMLSPLKHSPKEQPSPKHSNRQLEGSSTEILSASRISSRQHTEGRTMSETQMSTKGAKKSPSNLPTPAIPSSSSEVMGRSKKIRDPAGFSPITQNIPVPTGAQVWSAHQEGNQQTMKPLLQLIEMN
uniref:Uncharacterized protein n=1 Tax=Ditylenchus dipsaci TaxID=166011 RepID=A0A915EEA5_9BILA